MWRLLAAALLMGTVVAGASWILPQRDQEPVAGASPARPERDHQPAARASPVPAKRDREFVSTVRPVVREPEEEVERCAGAPVQPFERRLSEQVRRFAFDGAMLEPFLRLWQSGNRPDLPLSPESVTVYAMPGKPYVVGYQHEGCMIAFLAVPHQELWHWLRPRLGWSA